MKKILYLAMAAFCATTLTSCLGDDTTGYDDWREENNRYLANIDEKEYTKVVPSWAPDNSVYIKWHNDRALTANNLVPMSTSTVNVKYELEDINGNKIENSYSSTTNGDSIYQSKPNSNVIGMWAAMTVMHVGDSVTLIIPYNSGYGSTLKGSIKPYSNLIFHMKMKEIVAYEKE